MTELLSGSRNNNGIAIYLSQRPDGLKKIVKVSHTGAGIADLEREAIGWQWYHANQLCQGRPLNCVVSQRRASFIRIEIGFVDGVFHDYRKPFRENLPILNRCVEWYLERWPCGGHRSPIHGDFSLGNIIDVGDGIVVIDWEHFADTAAPWGVDVISLLLETLYFSRSKWIRRFERDVAATKPLFQKIVATGRLDDVFARAPLHALRTFVRETSHLSGDQVSKLPILLFSDHDVSLIDGILGMPNPTAGRL